MLKKIIHWIMKNVFSMEYIEEEKKVKWKLNEMSEKLEKLMRMSPSEFEYYCKDWYNDNGKGSAEVSPKGRYGGDGGIDLIIQNTREKVYGQCKKYIKGKNGYTPVKDIRELGGCMMRDGIKRGAFFSTLPYSEIAKREAKKMNIYLVGPELLQRA